MLVAARRARRAGLRLLLPEPPDPHPNQVYVSSSADGGASWSPSSALFVFYDLTQPLRLDFVHPSSAAVAGDAPLLLNGSNFAPAPEVSALCTFSQFGGVLGATPASYASPSQLKCLSPRLAADDAGAAELTLTAMISDEVATGDYGRVVDTLPFTFYDGSLPPQLTSLSPEGVPLATNTKVPAAVLVHGSNFAPTDLSCSIDGVPTAATFVRSSLVRCEAPDPPDHPASLELRVLRGELASDPLPFSFYDADAVPTTVAADPPYASVHGGSHVLISGEGYRPAGAALQCRVGGVHVPAHFASVTSVRSRAISPPPPPPRHTQGAPRTPLAPFPTSARPPPLDLASISPRSRLDLLR